MNSYLRFFAQRREKVQSRSQAARWQGRGLNPDPLDLIERDFIRRAVVELRRARAFMRGDGLRALDCAAIKEIRRDARRPEGMAVRRRAQLRVTAAPLNHPEHIDPAHPASAEAALFRHPPPQRLAFLVYDARRVNIRIEIFPRFVVRRHLVMLAASEAP